jgi:thiol-disulfide isomerase/thioredoxin
MRWLLVAVLGGLSSLALPGQVVGDVREALAQKDPARAERYVRAYREKSGVTPELLEALSWLGRGALESKHYDQAERYAAETRKLAVAELAKRPLDQEHHLPTALGAAIEVHAQVLAARGERSQAVAFLRQELARYRGTSIAMRLQKNINLLALEGKPAPPLEIAQWLGPKPVPLDQLRGHPVLLFFWAHWCPDCKAEAPDLAKLLAEYRSKGLVLIGPTQLYGYTGDDDAPPERETPYIDEVRKQYYSALSGMSVPVGAANFEKFGASTVPLLVLIDRRGIVRLYHPGALPYVQLSAKLAEMSRN